MAYIYNLTDTWNSGATTFDGIKMNVTDTASAAGSRLLNLQIGGADRAYVDKSGNGYFLGSVTAGSIITNSALSASRLNLTDSVTGTASTSTIDAATTWNTTGTPTAWKLNVTDTASNANSLLMDLRVGGSSVFSVSKSGSVASPSYTGASGGFSTVVFHGSVGSNANASVRDNVGLVVRSVSGYSWTSSNNNAGSGPIDLTLTRKGAANLQLGATDAAAPVAQSLSVQSVVAGTTNVAGANFTINGSQGTGTGAGGAIILQTAAAGTSGSAQNALTERMRIDSSGNVGIGTSSPANIVDIVHNQNAVSLARITNTDVGASARARLIVSNGTTQGGFSIMGTGASAPGEISIFNNSATAALVFAVGSGVERMRITAAGNVGIGTTTPDANGKVDILGNIDPGTTPAALSVRNTGVGGGTAAAQYGIRVSSQTYNSASSSYGIYAFSHQNVGNTTYGIWGDAGSPTQVGSSAQPFYGVTGRAYFNSAASHGLTNGTLPVGVYGTVVSTGSTNTAISAAGYFTNAATFGSEAYGIYVNVATGPTTTIAARFDFAGTEVARIDSAGGILSRGTGGIGYRTGAGGTVTQATSRTTGVTLNTVTGSITLVSAAGTTAWQSFTVTNSTVAANDVIKVVQRSGTDLYLIHVTSVAAGSFRITFATTGGTTTEQPVFNFAVIKGATS